jgi:hypothetical protein
MATQNAGGEGPRDLHLADIAGVDLLELAVALVVHVASLHRPVLGVGNVFLDVRIGKGQQWHRE